MRGTSRFLPIALIAVVALSSSARANEANEWDETVDKSVAYLRKTQAKDGSWGGKQAVGVTGVIVTGLLRTGKVSAKDPMVDKALAYIETLITKEGHIAGKGATANLHNYVTSINVMALVAADRPAYKAPIENAVAFLKKLQWDEGHGKDAKSDFHGGAGYDSKSRPDLSNTQFFLEALVAAGLTKKDPTFAKAVIFVSRCQNMKGESNDQPWAGKIDDGSFIYTAAKGGDTKVADDLDPKADGGLPGYGSMTYAGVKSLLYCGIDKKDPRVVKARAWLAKNYTVERNPGMGKDREQWGIYYYYLAMARCLDALGEDRFIDEKGAKHDWRAEITSALAKRQQANGGWANASDRWMEGNTALVTGYALMTLATTKPKK